MDLVDVAFRTGVDLTRRRLLKGPEYAYVGDATLSVRAARVRVIAWTDLDLRRKAMAILKGFEEDVAEGQRQLLLRASDYPASLREAAAAVIAELLG